MGRTLVEQWPQSRHERQAHGDHFVDEGIELIKKAHLRCDVSQKNFGGSWSEF